MYLGPDSQGITFVERKFAVLNFLCVFDTVSRNIPSLEVKIGDNPSCLAYSLFTAYAFRRTTFIELAV